MLSSSTCSAHLSGWARIETSDPNTLDDYRKGSAHLSGWARIETGKNPSCPNKKLVAPTCQGGRGLKPAVFCCCLPFPRSAHRGLGVRSCLLMFLCLLRRKHLPVLFERPFAMARPLRIEFAGAVYHITSRGNERKEVFRNDKDRAAFLDILAKCCNLFNWVCHTYCLMSDHYHLVIETLHSTLSRGMRQLNGVYTQKFNWNHDRGGHLFQGRYKAVLIEKESHLLEACRYVVLNPIRAKIIADPKQWQWSSYRGTCGFATPAACLTVDWVLQQFGNTRKPAIKKYRKFHRWSSHWDYAM